ncbi:MAG: hypothetical protein ACP5OE_08840, partial [Thermodesulfobium sp.]
MNIIRSLKESTYIKVVGRNESIEIDGRCSPYTSHQSIEFSWGHEVPRTLYFENEKFSIIVSGELPDIDNRGLNVGIVQIPAFLIRTTILPEIYKDLRWLKDDRSVWVIYPDGFQNFDEDGKPIFVKVREKVRINVEEKFSTFIISDGMEGDL